MLPQEIIRKKRDGGTLDPAEIAAFVDGLTSGQFSEGQVAALAMAVFFNGMSAAETVALTRAMTESGTRLDWRDLDGPVVDKHSTGGIGDKVSLILAPLIAACGGYVPMISGRGLGHTGGTLDKLDSIPGYRTTPDQAQFMATVRAAGCAIIGQTDDLAPADRRLYAIRDITATVESMPLIVGSILSKKLAAGLDALVMDVKVGSGAFLPSIAAATDLATNLVTVAGGAGLPCRALLTDMNQCLGWTAGNALEVAEALDLLTGRRTEPRLAEISLALAAEALVLSGLATDRSGARSAVDAALGSGAAAERFGRMVHALGGPADLLDHPDHLPTAPVRAPIFPERTGVITAVDARALGVAVIELGGGRRQAGDLIDHAVGLGDVRAIGAPVGPESPLAVVHARTDADARAAAARVRAAITIGAAAPPSGPLIIDRIEQLENT